MEIIPAIDLLQNKAVRLFKGDYNQAKVYSELPWELAMEFENSGATWLHLVDLDGAREGFPGNINTLKKIRENCNLSIQLGGGIRNLEALAMYNDLGINRFILGTAAITNPSFLENCLIKYGEERILVSVDTKDGMVRTSGWIGDSQIHYNVYLKQLESMGVKYIVFTDISLDGTLQGPNIPLYKEILNQFKFQLIASGGISSLEDLKSLMNLSNEKLEGVIVGKALYEKKFHLQEAVSLIKTRG